MFDATIGWGVIAMVAIPGFGFVGWLGKVHLRQSDLSEANKDLHTKVEAAHAAAAGIAVDLLKYRMEVAETYVKSRELDKMEASIAQRFEKSDAAMVKRFDEVRHEIKQINSSFIAALTLKANGSKDA